MIAGQPLPAHRDFCDAELRVRDLLQAKRGRDRSPLTLICSRMWHRPPAPPRSRPTPAMPLPDIPAMQQPEPAEIPEVAPPRAGDQGRQLCRDRWRSR